MEAYAYFSSPIYREERPQWVEETLKYTQKYYEQIEPRVVSQSRSVPTFQTRKTHTHLLNNPDPLKY